MSLKNQAKNILKKKARKVIFHLIKPFLPYIIIILLLFFAICTIIDAVFIQEVQTSDSSLPEAQLEIKNKCIDMSEKLNTCHNYIGNDENNNLLDANNLENDKLIEWSHLYAIMAFHNMSNNRKINESLLNEVSKEFESTFRYEKTNVTTEVTVTDEDGNKTTTIEELAQFILVESDTIYGHYKYSYEDKTTEVDGKKTTKKVFVGEELLGEKYERLRKYLKHEFHIKESDLDDNVQIIIEAASGYYSGSENISWLQNTPTSAEIITDGKKLVPKGMFTWPIPGYTKITSHFGMRVHPITGVYKLHSGTDVGAPIGAKFVAMADGTVIKATYNTAYGNMVMIDHRKWYCNFICTWL